MTLLEHFKVLTLHPKNAEELKGLILQLAIQGKLTAQWRRDNPDVESASVLLEKIAKEKAEILPSNYIKKDQALPELRKEDITNDLPVSWVWCRFADIVINRDGERRPITKSNRIKGDYDYYGASGIIDKVKEYIFDKDLLLIGEDGANLIARSTPIAFFARGKYWVNNHAHVLDATDFTILEYLEKFINGINLETYITGMAQPKMPQKRMNIIPISLPPLEEQKAIVATVNALFAEVEQLEDATKQRIQLKEDFVTSALRQLSTEDTTSAWSFLQPHFKSFFTEKSSVKKLRESILQLAVQGKLTKDWREQQLRSGVEVEDASVLLERIKAEKETLIKGKSIKTDKPLPAFNQVDIPYELPPSWLWCRLEDLTSITGGVAKGKRNQTDIIITPYLRVANVQRGFLNLALIKEIPVSKVDYQKYQLKRNDLLMIEGGDPDKLGRCAIWGSEIPGCIHQNHVFRVRPYLDFVVKNHYLMQFINSKITRDYYENCAKRTTNLASINKTQMRSTPIALPPLEEQNAIVQKVNALMSLCDGLEKEIETHERTQEDWMQRCLREVFEGKSVSHV